MPFNKAWFRWISMETTEAYIDYLDGVAIKVSMHIGQMASCAQPIAKTGLEQSMC